MLNEALLWSLLWKGPIVEEHDASGGVAIPLDSED